MLIRRRRGCRVCHCRGPVEVIGHADSRKGGSTTLHVLLMRTFSLKSQSCCSYYKESDSFFFFFLGRMSFHLSVRASRKDVSPVSLKPFWVGDLMITSGISEEVEGGNIPVLSSHSSESYSELIWTCNLRQKDLGPPPFKS